MITNATPAPKNLMTPLRTSPPPADIQATITEEEKEAAFFAAIDAAPAEPTDFKAEREARRRSLDEDRRETTRRVQQSQLPPAEDAGLMLLEPLDLDDPIVSGMFERGDKALIIGASKARKTFFALQMALCLAAGKPFLNFAIPKPRSTLYINFEIKRTHMHRRLVHMANRLAIEVNDLRGWLHFHCLRGFGVNIGNLESVVQSSGIDFDVLILDPLYKLFSAGTDENAAGDLADVMRGMDEICQSTGAATIVVHHDPKSKPDKSINRGAGSGLIGRDGDAFFYIDPHFSDPEAITVQTISRNYPARPPLAARFAAGAFQLAEDLPAVSEPAAAAVLDLQSIAAEVADNFGYQPRSLADVKKDIAKGYDLSDHPVRNVIGFLYNRHGFTRKGGYGRKPVELTPPPPWSKEARIVRDADEDSDDETA